MNPDGKFGEASKEEDARIMELIAQHGAGNWDAVAKALGNGRNSRFVLARWKVLGNKVEVEKHFLNHKIKQRTSRPIPNRKSAKTELKPEDYEVHIESVKG